MSSADATADPFAVIQSALSACLAGGSFRQSNAALLAAALSQTASEYGFIGTFVDDALRVHTHAGVVWDTTRHHEFYERAVRTYLEVGYIEFVDLQTLYGAVLSGGEPVISNDPANDPRAGAQLPPGHPPLFAFLGAPILREGEVVGMIAVANRAGGYAEAQRATLTLLTSAASVLYDGRHRPDAKRLVHAHSRGVADSLRESEARFRHVFDRAADAAFLSDLEGRFVDVNQRACDALGYTRPELLALTVADVVLDFDADAIRHVSRDVHASPDGGVITKRVTHTRKDGSTYPGEAHLSSIELDDQPLVLAFSRDLGRRTQAEERLALYREVFAQTAEALAILDPDGRYLEQNRAHRALLGFADEELVGRGLGDAWLGEQPERLLLSELRRCGRYHGDAIARTRDGRVLQLQLSASSVQGDAARCHTVLTLRTDARLAAAVEQIAEGIAIADPSGRIQYANSAFEGITGYSAAEANGRLLYDLSDSPERNELSRAIAREAAWSGTLAQRRKNGDRYDVEHVLSPVRDPAGHLIHFVSTQRDVTLSRRAQRLESLGELLAGVAHEINNPVHFILLNLPLLEEGVRDLLGVAESALASQPERKLARLPWTTLRDELPRVLDRIGLGAKRIYSLTQDLKAFAQPDTDGAWSEFEPAKSIETALTLTRLQVREAGVDLEEHIAAALPKLWGPRRHLEQTLVNLLLNATQAASGSGKRVRISAANRDGDLEITVSDSGPGIPVSHRARIFDPFFTTRRGEGGTGLGLSLCHRMVEQLKGEIRVEDHSELGGASFRLVFPRGDGRAP